MWAGHTQNLWSATPLPTEPERAETTTYEGSKGTQEGGGRTSETRPRPARSTHSGQKGQVTNVGPQRRRPGPQAKWYETPAAVVRTRGQGSSPGSSIPTNVNLGKQPRRPRAWVPASCMWNPVRRLAPGSSLTSSAWGGRLRTESVNGRSASLPFLKQKKKKTKNKPSFKSHTQTPAWSRAVSPASPRVPGSPYLDSGANQRRWLPKPLGKQPQRLHHLCIGVCGPVWQRSHSAAAQVGTHTRTEQDCWVQTQCAKQKPPASACASTPTNYPPNVTHLFI